MSPEQLAKIREDRAAYWPLATNAMNNAHALAEDGDRPEGAQPIVEALRASDRLADHVQDLLAEVERLRRGEEDW